ncbi:hypothetical protein C8J47_2954 [Sphingomonas sp. PP-F2F-G114-C0414]|nr:hypothetical protein C8J47_2954 [Sphingomonas sp. PP-F2F-G114-C0414]
MPAKGARVSSRQAYIVAYDRLKTNSSQIEIISHFAEPGFPDG